METIETILTRKSVRSFENKHIEDEKIETLMKAAMAAPSGVNCQPWEFYVCKSEEVKKEVKKCIPFGQYNADIVIITCIKEAKTFALMRDLAHCDLSAATENILLAAHDMGLGGVWCAVYPDKLRMKAVKKALKLPIGITPFSAIYLGYPAKNDKSKVKEKYDNKKVRII